MPIYKYECLAAECGRVFEELVRCDLADAPTACECGGAIKKYGAYETADAVPTLTADERRMGAGERKLHTRHKKDIEKAAANGTLIETRGGKRTPSEFKPVFPKTLH